MQGLFGRRDVRISGKVQNHMEYIRVATIESHESQPLKSYSVFGRKVGIFRREDGSYYGIETNCKHQGADLLTGLIEGSVVTCPRHKWRYDLLTGQCLSNDSPPLRQYEVVVDGDSLKIAIQPLDL